MLATGFAQTYEFGDESVGTLKKFRIHNSILVKQSLGFLIVGILGIIVASLFFLFSTQRQFKRFLRESSQPQLSNVLADYYAEQGNWDYLPEFFETGLDASSDQPRPPVVIKSTDGQVVYSDRPTEPEEPAPPDTSEHEIPIRVDGEVVGWMTYPSRNGRPPPGTPEAIFLSNITGALLYSIPMATAVAVAAGFLLARTLTRPIRELTEATQAIANGNLNQQVAVHTQDELGELAASFNQMSADLVNAIELRQQMTADLAHELRSPLSVILGYAEALSDGKLPGSADTFESMYTEALHLQRLIEDLRTLSLADAGELPLTRLSVTIQSLLKRVASAYTAQAQMRGIGLEVQVPADETRKLFVDPDRISQVLGNLISNALRYTPEGGKIVLAAKPVDDRIQLTVQDNGAGIASEDLPFVFERFYRGDKSRQLSNNNESGLGLAIARSIVETHGGKITVDSIPGKGTSFTIEMPMLES